VRSAYQFDFEIRRELTPPNFAADLLRDRLAFAFLATAKVMARWDVRRHRLPAGRRLTIEAGRWRDCSIEWDEADLPLIRVGTGSCPRDVPRSSEWLLWQALKRRQLGVTFRRQVVLCGYIADFYASSVKLIVEVDGAWHATRRADTRRDRVLSRAGYRVLRVSSEEVLTALPAVLAKVREAL